MLQEGQTIAGKYQVEALLGEGAFGEVYRVRHIWLHRLEALKILKTFGLSLEETRALMEEARVLCALVHPNIVRVLDADILQTDRGICCIFTMEYVGGGTLEDFRRRYGPAPIPVDRTIDIMIQVCEGLAVAHAERPPIVHRDIKPSNILVGYVGDHVQPRISDFGLAKQVNPLTLRVSARGDLHFQPPEIFRNQLSYTRASDVWSLGVTLYVMLTNALPYAIRISNLGEIDASSFRDQLVPAARRNLAVDARLDAIVTRTLALRPEDRYQSATELLDELQAWRSVALAYRNRPTTEVPEIVDAHRTGPDPGEIQAEPAYSEVEGRRLLQEALSRAMTAGRPVEAAELLERAFRAWPPLREAHDYRLELWRRGVIE